MQSILALLYIVTLLQLCAARAAQVNEDFASRNDDATITSFDWETLTATPYLNYTACYDGFECARLEVPLDWTNTSNHNKVQLAIIRLPASVPETDPSFGGTILFNPGGPGGSGIDVMRWTGNGIRDVVDSDVHFELLSWDPRGMHHTTPSISCFDDNWQREIWMYRNNAVGPMDASRTSLYQRWALTKSVGKLCEQNDIGSYPDGMKIAQFATTALVARDMVEIIDQVESHRLGVSRPLLHANEQQRLLNSRPPALLNYWGYSYGSYLGNTFASMFPSRIGRMIMDSVVDTDDYTSTQWLGNLLDWNKTLGFFYRDCFEAKSLCALNKLPISSPADMAGYVDKLLYQLKLSPIVTLHGGAPDIVTFADVSSLMFSTMYYPSWSWPELAEILADLINGNATSMAKYLQVPRIPTNHRYQEDIDRQLLQGLNETQAYPPAYPEEAEAAHGPMCGDGEDITHLSVEDWAERLAILHSQTPIAGWKWSEPTLLCAHWPKSWRPAEHNRFKGPWSSKLADYDARASPLLFIGGTADPVLPLKNAYKAAALHEGARVLIQDAPGHCTGYINPVSCTWSYVKRFFAEGILPKNNTICDRDGTPWLRYDALGAAYT